MPESMMQKVEILTLCLMLIFIVMQCEDFLPSDYRDESYRISSVDADACEYLFRDFFKTDTVVVGEDTSYVQDTLYIGLRTKVMAELVDTARYHGKGDLEIMGESFAEVWGGLDMMEVDTTLGVSNASLADTSYVGYDHTASSKVVKIYGGWIYEWLEDLNADNLDGYLDIDLIGSDGRVVGRDIENISLEAVSGCTQYVEWRDNYFPRIKVSNKYEINSGRYIVRIIIAEPEKVGAYRLVILD